MNTALSTLFGSVGNTKRTYKYMDPCRSSIERWQLGMNERMRANEQFDSNLIEKFHAVQRPLMVFLCAYCSAVAYSRPVFDFTEHRRGEYRFHFIDFNSV